MNAQSEFDRTYITASEVMQKVKISRAGLLYARRSGRLPQPIVVNGGRLLIWLREEMLEPINHLKGGCTTIPSMKTDSTFPMN